MGGKEDAYKLYNAMWNNKKLGYIRDKELAFVLNDYMINPSEWTVAEKAGSTLRIPTEYQYNKNEKDFSNIQLLAYCTYNKLS